MSIDKDKDAKDEGAGTNETPPAEKPVGYKQPPVVHQFKNGVCPNPRGRPRKDERSYTPRQWRRDILRIGSTLTTIKTDKGIQKITLIEAIILRTASKALSGHGPSSRFFMKEHSLALREHNEIHDKWFSMLESMEQAFVFDLKGFDTNGCRKELNKFRKLTRRT